MFGHPRGQHHLAKPVKVAFDRVLDAGILNLHRDRLAGLGYGAMNLPERRRRKGSAIKLREDLLGLLAHARAELRVHERCMHPGRTHL